jgi:hypothetical protein
MSVTTWPPAVVPSNVEVGEPQLEAVAAADADQETTAGETAAVGSRHHVVGLHVVGRLEADRVDLDKRTPSSEGALIVLPQRVSGTDISVG